MGTPGGQVLVDAVAAGIQLAVIGVAFVGLRDARAETRRARAEARRERLLRLAAPLMKISATVTPLGYESNAGPEHQVRISNGSDEAFMIFADVGSSRSGPFDLPAGGDVTFQVPAPVDQAKTAEISWLRDLDGRTWRQTAGKWTVIEEPADRVQAG